MEDRKAKFVVFIVVALIAFVCSSAVFSVTGGLSDWLVSSMNYNEDANNNGILDSSENNGYYYSTGNDNYNYEENSDNGGGFDIMSMLTSDSNTGGEEPDLLARILRQFIGGSSLTDTVADSDSNYYSEDTYYDDGSQYYYTDEGNSNIQFSSFDDLLSRANEKLDSILN